MNRQIATVTTLIIGATAAIGYRAASVPAIAPPAPRISRAYMPALVNVPAWMLATAAPKPPTPQPLPPVPTPLVVRPATYEELRRAVAVPGAYVVPMPGTYRPSRPLKIAPGVTLDGHGQVTIYGKTVELYNADGATVRRIAVRDAAGDGIRVSHTHRATIEGVQVSGSKDGELDLVEGPDDGAVIIVRDSVIGPGRKCMLAGDPDQGQDARMVVVLERVTFTDCHVRVPKAHWVLLEMRDSTIYHWSGPRIDAQLGARIRIKGNTWIAGPESLPGDYLPTGGRVEDLGGNVYRDWRGMQ
jgi:hypothetical protein